MTRQCFRCGTMVDGERSDGSLRVHHCPHGRICRLVDNTIHPECEQCPRRGVEKTPRFVGEGFVEIAIPVPRGASSLRLRLTVEAANALLRAGTLTAFWAVEQNEKEIQWGLEAGSIGAHLGGESR